MKKIIGGKVYDTETAKLLASWDHAITDGLNRVEEELYAKRTGEFFIWGSGGPNTKYAVSLAQNSWSGGTQIIPLDYDAAQKWAEEHLDGDMYEAIFGAPSESDTVTALHCQIDSAVLARVRQLASAEGCTLGAWVENALKKQIDA